MSVKIPVHCLALAIVGAAMILPSAADARFPGVHAAGMRLAKRHHVSQRQCYAEVFTRYAVLNRHSRWRWPSGRRSMAVQSAYRQDLFSLCGVSA